MDPHYPPFNLTIPDQYRMDYWIPEFQRLDAANQVPNLTILWLPDDHTAGTTKGQPYPDQLPGRQRSGARPHGGCDQPQQGMGAIGDLRRGRRFAGRRRSRGWPPPAGVRHQPLYGGSAGARPGQGDSYDVHRREHQSHDREHSGHAAADAVRSGGIAHVRRVSEHARPDAVRPPGGGHPSRPGTGSAGQSRSAGVSARCRKPGSRPRRR